ncbi:MAG: DUF3606 domain-containing protein [Burkholderiaceae bacterium]|nr:DUF3606 domain-containing protein [Burkholderiaceae bacterium]
MSDNKYQVGGQDRRRINIHEDQELRDWSKALHVTPDALRKAVAQAGDNADAVRDYLKKEPDHTAPRQR